MELTKRPIEDDNLPPNSRLYVVCGKTVTEQVLMQAFGRFGNVQNIHIVRDRTTQEPKGFCFIKFDRSSSAMLALENLNAFLLDNESRPLKVVVAEAKGALPSPQPDHLSPGDTPANSRLYVVCPKDMTEDTLSALFSQYGQVEHVHVVRDKLTQLSKGFAYVKYPKASVAALAMEELNNNQMSVATDRKIKVVIAQPRGSKPSLASALNGLSLGGPHAYGGMFAGGAPHSNTQQSYDGMNYGMGMGMGGLGGMPMGDVQPRYLNNFTHTQQPLNLGGGEPIETTRVFITMPQALPEAYLVEYFKVFGGLEYVHMLKGKNCGFVKYQTSSQAAHAIQQMNGNDIHGQKIRAVIAEPPRTKQRQRDE